MNIIVLTNCSWDESGSVGNTLSNWFGGWENARFSNLYCREALPHNNCCNNYFQVSPTNILKHLLCPWKIGKCFNNDVAFREEQNTESNLINSTRGKKSRELFLLLSELLYSSRIWFNKRIKSFIANQQPDLCFCFAISDPFRYYLCKYLKKQSLPIIMFVADDVYGAYIKQKGYVSRRYRKRFESMIMMADKVYGASEMMCEKYAKQFGIEVSPLYKGCDLSKPKCYVNKPIRMAYAGNLFYGRSNTLGSIAKALNQINEEKGMTAQLEIYTASPISKEIDLALNVEGTSKIMGPKPYSEIVEILKNVDVVLHVESFEKDQIEIVKYSFSTKIIDCLQSGSVMMVVGPKGIASVEYPRTIPGTIVVDNTKDLRSVLLSVLKNPESLLEKAKNTYAFASNTFPIDIVRDKIQNDFVEITKVSY